MPLVVGVFLWPRRPSPRPLPFRSDPIVGGPADRAVLSTPVTTSRAARHKACKCYHGDVFFFCAVASAFEATIVAVSDGRNCAPDDG